MKILLVEDSENDAKLFSNYVLAELNAEIRVAETLTIGLALDKEWKPDVVLLDLHLKPSSPSHITITHIHEFLAPVIVTTAMPDHTLEVKSRAEGARAFFQKMDAIAEPELFRAAIKSVCNK